MLWRVEYEIHAEGRKQPAAAFVECEPQAQIWAILQRVNNRDILIRHIELVGTGSPSPNSPERVWQAWLG